jgi:hypothetical protein
MGINEYLSLDPQGKVVKYELYLRNASRTIPDLHSPVQSTYEQARNNTALGNGIMRAITKHFLK